MTSTLTECVLGKVQCLLLIVSKELFFKSFLCLSQFIRWLLVTFPLEANSQDVSGIVEMFLLLSHCHGIYWHEHLAEFYNAFAWAAIQLTLFLCSGTHYGGACFLMLKDRHYFLFPYCSSSSSFSHSSFQYVIAIIMLEGHFLSWVNTEMAEVGVNWWFSIWSLILW